MTILEALRLYLSSCPYLDGLTDGIHIDWIHQDDPSDYGIYNGGDILVGEDMAGNQTRQFTFYIQSSRIGAQNDDFMVSNSNLLENIQNWLNARRHVPFALPDSCDFIYLTAGNGTAVDVSEDGQSYLYRIPANFTYERNI